MIFVFFFSVCALAGAGDARSDVMANGPMMFNRCGSGRLFVLGACCWSSFVLVPWYRAVTCVVMRSGGRKRGNDKKIREGRRSATNCICTNACSERSK